MNKKPYKGTPYRKCSKCGTMGYFYAYCASCSQKINEEYERKRRETETRVKKGN